MEKARLTVVQSNGEATAAIVEMLEGYLDAAKEGNVSDIAIICKLKGEPMTEFCGWDSDRPLELVGALRVAEMEILKELISPEELEDDTDGN